MSDFNSLDDYYEYLEKDSSLLHDVNLTNRLLSLRDRLSDEILKSNCTYEALFVQFPIRKGEFHPQISYTDGDGFPNLSLFANGLDYIKFRAAHTSNAKFKGKYNQLLWESLKHNDFGNAAVDNYYALLDRAYTHDADIAGDNSTQQVFQNYFETLFVISQRLNYRNKDVLALFETYLRSEKLNAFEKVSIMTFIATEAKKNDPATLQTFFDYSKQAVDGGEHPVLIEKYLELRILLSQKLKASAAPIYEELAEHFLAEAKKRKDFIAHDFYLKAISNFQKAGNKAKVEEVSVLLETAKRTLNFKTITTEHSSELLNTLWKNTLEHLDKVIEPGESDDIYQYLIHADGLIPQASALGDNIQPDIFKLMRVMSFDINKNVANNGVGGVNSYLLHIQNFTLRKLWYIFSNGIKARKISYDSLMSYLKHRSWYGQDFTYVDGDGTVQGFNWIQMISPSLLSFFQQSEIDMTLKKNNDEGYILAVDSLSLKFEGFLRELCRAIGAQTIEFKADGTEERISFDKLLSGEKIQALLPADDIAFLKFLFTDAGLNLRNNVAHCFYPARKYSAGIMFLLFVALLRLGNYSLSPRTDQ